MPLDGSAAWRAARAAYVRLHFRNRDQQKHSRCPLRLFQLFCVYRTSLVRLCCLKTRADQFHVILRDPLTGRRFLLETMQDINRLLETDRVRHPVSVSLVILHQLEHSRALALPGLGGRRLAAHLHHAQSVSKIIHHHTRKGQQILTSRSPPSEVAFPPVSTATW